MLNIRFPTCRARPLQFPFVRGLAPQWREAEHFNARLFDLLNGSPQMAREAVDAVNDFTRTRMRGAGFFRRIMPPIPIPDEELDWAADTDTPARIVDQQTCVDSPGGDR